MSQDDPLKTYDGLHLLPDDSWQEWWSRQESKLTPEQRQWLASQREILRQVFAPGRFWGDVGLVLGGDEPGREAALRRLVGGPFCRKAIFFEARWLALEGRFEAYRRDVTYSLRGADKNAEASWAAAYFHAAAPAVYQALRQAVASLDPSHYKELYPSLRKAVRTGVEKTITGGWTIEKARTREQHVPDDLLWSDDRSIQREEAYGNPEAEKAEDGNIEPWTDEAQRYALEISQETERLIEMNIDLARAFLLARLSPAERDAFLSEGGDAAVRKRRERARKKLKDILAGRHKVA